MSVTIYHGDFVYAGTEKELTEIKNGYLVEEKGTVTGVYPVLPDEYAGAPVVDFDGVMIPAFSDLHTHAPQYPQRGLRTDVLLSDWLEKYTFPLEAKYADPAFYTAVYDAFVDDLIAHGTMRAAIFGTIHPEATGYLVERLEAKGLDAYVGKVNMDVNSPASLSEKTEISLRETEAFLEKYAGNKTARPILTPRFAPTCGRELLTGLGKLAKKYGVGVQTHLVESRWEAAEATRLYPDCACDTEIYEKTGLLGYGPFIGAHFIFPSERDVEILKKYDGYAVQCPDATTNVIAGIMATADLSERGVRLALGSDVAAGQSLGIYTQAAASVRLSKIKSFYEPEHKAISFAQAFYRATKGGGALFGKAGSFEKGYVFDALIVDGISDGFAPLTPAETVERFCYAGETGQIRARFLRGKRIPG